MLYGCGCVGGLWVLSLRMLYNCTGRCVGVLCLLVFWCIITVNVLILHETLHVTIFNLPILELRSKGSKRNIKTNGESITLGRVKMVATWCCWTKF